MDIRRELTENLQLRNRLCCILVEGWQLNEHKARQTGLAAQCKNCHVCSLIVVTSTTFFCHWDKCIVIMMLEMLWCIEHFLLINTQSFHVYNIFIEESQQTWASCSPCRIGFSLSASRSPIHSLTSEWFNAAIQHQTSYSKKLAFLAFESKSNPKHKMRWQDLKKKGHFTLHNYSLEQVLVDVKDRTYSISLENPCMYHKRKSLT